MANKAAKRASNFNAAEIDVLMNYVKSYQHIIECKKSDSNTNVRKQEIWKTIETEFNASNPTQQFRTAGVLRKKWENIKKNTKNKVADEKHAFEDTGGGPPKDVTFNPEEKAAMEILGDQRVSGAKFAFDCDSEIIYDNYITISSVPIPVEEELDEYTIDDPDPIAVQTPSGKVFGKVDLANSNNKTNSAQPRVRLCEKDRPIQMSQWKNYTPETLRQPISPCLVAEKVQSCTSTNLGIPNSGAPSPLETSPPLETGLSTSTLGMSRYSRKRAQIQDKIDTWVNKRANVAEEEGSLCKEKLENEKKLHVLRERKLNQEIQHAAEKHSLEMEILQLQKKLLERQLEAPVEERN